MRVRFFQYLIVSGLLAALISCRQEFNECHGTCGKIYVANEGNESITVIDASDYQVIKFIRVTDEHDMMMIHNIQASPDGHSVWATFNRMESGESGFLTIDPATDEITNAIVLGQDWNVAHVVFDSTSSFAYIIATDSNMIAEINTSSLVVTRKFHLGAMHAPHGLRYSRGKLYVANMTARSLSIVDVISGNVSEVPAGGIAVQTAVIPGRFAFASLYDAKRIFSYDITSGDTASYSLPAIAQGPIQIYPVGENRLLICDQGLLYGRASSDQLFIMDVETGAITSSITVGDGAHGVVADPNGHVAYCTNREDHTITVADVHAATVICTIPVGTNPNGITFWRTTGGQP